MNYLSFDAVILCGREKYTDLEVFIYFLLLSQGHTRKLIYDLPSDGLLESKGDIS